MKAVQKIIKSLGLVALISLAGFYFFSFPVWAATSSTSGTTSVSATVPGSGGGSGDTTPPAAINNLAVSATGVTSVTLTWTSPGDNGNDGLASRYAIRYTTAGYITTDANWSSATAVISPPVPLIAGTVQTFTVAGLTGNTTYYFSIKTADAAGNWSGLSNSPSGKTTIAPDITPPVIFNIQVTHITGTTATVSWSTDENATSTIRYGRTMGYELGSQSSSQLTASHSFDLSNLQPNTTYHFQVQSTDASYNTATFADQTFTTLDITPPVISNIVVDPHINYAVVAWTTDKAADSQVAYGLTTGLGTLTSDVNLKTSHSITLSNLLPNVRNYYAVRSTDSSGNQGASATLSFVTLPDASPPANVADFQGIAGDAKVTLSWQNPSDIDFAGVLIRRSTADYPRTISEDAQAYRGGGMQFIDTGLTNGTLYYYTAFAYDTSDNHASGALTAATPVGGVIPPQPPELPPVVPPGGLGGVIPPPTTTSTISGLSLSNLELFTARRALRVQLTDQGVGQILSGQDLIVSVNINLLSRPVKDLTLKIGDTAYLLVKDRFDNYSADISMPTAPGSYGVKAVFNFDTGAPEELNFIIEVAPGGQIYASVNGEHLPISGARVELFSLNVTGAWESWNAAAYHQTNPQITGDVGFYGFAVPNGIYYLHVTHDGYRIQNTNQFNVDNQIINQAVELLVVPPPLKEVIDLNAPLTENIQAVAKNLGQKTVYTAKIVQQVVTSPEVRKVTQDVAAPVVTGAAVVGTAAATGSELLLYLRFLFTQPILIFFRRKRKGWGIVYNSLTKLPIDLVIVRLVDAETHRVMQSRVTDKEGRYAFIASPGRYRLEITPDQFVFPTKFLAEAKDDGSFVDIYHGEVIEVTEKGALVTANIPLDPIGAEKPLSLILRQVVLRRLQNVISIVSLILSVVFVFITPGWLTIGLLIVQLASYWIFRHLATPPKPKSWGIVYDEHDKQPLHTVVARIFDKQYNKLLETQVTDARGRYSFLVGRNEYYITYEKDKYEKKTTDTIDLKNQPDPTFSIGLDMSLKRAGNLPTPPPTVTPPAPPVAPNPSMEPPAPLLPPSQPPSPPVLPTTGSPSPAEPPKL